MYFGIKNVLIKNVLKLCQVFTAMLKPEKCVIVFKVTVLFICLSVAMTAEREGKGVGAWD